MIRSKPAPSSDFYQFIGIPYREPDAPPEALGMNCWEIVEAIMVQVFGVTPPKYSYKVPATKAAAVFLSELKNWIQISSDDRQPGDLVLLNVNGYPMHVGILVSEDKMIHTLREHGSVCVSIKNAWQKRIEGFYRWIPNH